MIIIKYRGQTHAYVRHGAFFFSLIKSLYWAISLQCSRACVLAFSKSYCFMLLYFFPIVFPYSIEFIAVFPYSIVFVTVVLHSTVFAIVCLLYCFIKIKTPPTYSPNCNIIFATTNHSYCFEGEQTSRFTSVYFFLLFAVQLRHYILINYKFILLDRDWLGFFHFEAISTNKAFVKVFK